MYHCLKHLLAFYLLTHVSGLLAADIPPGTELAEKQELVRGNNAEPGSLDPNRVEGVPGANIARDLFEGLVNQDLEGNTIPGLATEWTSLEDNYKWVFKLRKTGRWSNGDPVTAHDFVYAWRRITNPATAATYAWFLEMAAVLNAGAISQGEQAPGTLGVLAKDDYTLEVTLEKPIPYFVRMMAHPSTYPVHRGSIEKFGEQWTRPGNIVSNGAYQLDQWVVNERIVLKRNPHYWNDAKTVINKVTFLPIVSRTGELNRYKAGEVELTGGIPLEHFKRLSKTLPNELKRQKRLATVFYAFNTKTPPFDDKRIRKALALAVDRDVLTKYVLGRGEQPAYAFTPEVVSGYNPPLPEWASWTQAQRDAEARRLYAAAGYSKANPLKIGLLYNTSEGAKKIALAINSMWKRSLGVQATLENQEWKTFLENLRLGKFQTSMSGWVGDYNEASSMLDLAVSTHGNNNAKYNNPEYDRIMRESKLLMDEKARNSLYDQAEKILAEDVPNMPLYQSMNVILLKPYVGGYAENNPEGRFYTRNMYIIKH
ncbi:MAG: ABC transporter substrate-binding protein [Pseudomonadota bacterium]